MSDKSNADIYPFTADPDSPDSVEVQRHRYNYFGDHPDYNSVRQSMYEKVHGKGATAQDMMTTRSHGDLSPGATRCIVSEDNVNAVKAELAATKNYAARGDRLINALAWSLIISASIHIITFVYLLTR